MNPTIQQMNFLSALLNTTSNLALVARAGCGKTSTILMGVNAYVKKFPLHEVIVCAYNKAIADEVKQKLVEAGHTNWKKVSATTIHSLGWGLIRFVFKSEIKENKVRDLIDRKIEGNSLSVEMKEICEQYQHQIRQLVSYAKGAGVGFFGDAPIGDPTTWYQLADHYDVNGLEDTSMIDKIVELAQIVYRESLEQTTVVDFDDMILFPLIKNLKVKFGKDLIFLDEAQDLSRARQALARKFIKPGGRMVIVGDDRQAIYGFSGADASALDNLVKGLSAVQLPLSVTWRCPKSVVAEAQRLVPDIEAAPSAPEGKVNRIAKLPATLAAGDAVLCRNTKPLIKEAFKLIRAKKPVKVEGRAIGDSLANLAGRWKIQTIDSLIKRLEDFKATEMQKAMAKGDERKAEEAADRVDTLLEICNACIQQNKTRIDDVKEWIQKLFVDGAKDAIIMATYHRSKGREWPNVYLLDHEKLCPAKAAKQEWQLVQEFNLAYVAITRAQSTLNYVGGGAMIGDEVEDGSF